MSVSGRLGFGVAAGLDPGLAKELGVLFAELGYTTLWSNDHPKASGLETVAALGEGAPGLDLAVGALALDRHSPKQVAVKVDELGIGPGRLLLALGAGFTKKPLSTVRQGVEMMREALPEGTRLLVAAMGPKMCTLAGEIADGVMLNWMTPERASWARELVEQGARSAGRDTPPLYGYLRVAVDEKASERLAKEEGFYRELHQGYRKHFAALGSEPGTIGIATSDSVQVRAAIDEFRPALDEVVVRALASANFDSMAEVAKAAISYIPENRRKGDE